MLDIAALSYVVSGFLYAFFVLILIISWRGKFQGAMLISAAIISVFWSAIHAYQHITPELPGWLIFFIDALRNGIWLVFIVALVNDTDKRLFSKKIEKSIYLTFFIILILGVVVEAIFESYTPYSSSNQIPMIGLLILSLAGMVLVEQMYRNSASRTSKSTTFLAISLGSVFAYDIYTYSTIFILKDVESYVWTIRAGISALIVPVLAIYARRNPELSLEIFVSRHVVFYTTSLIVTGLYLLTVAVGGYYIKQFGGKWAEIFQLIFFFTAAIMLIFILTSSSNRARLKVFISKHFYQNRYDYREEWMRLNKILSNHNNVEEVRKQVLVALTDILDSKGAQLWLKQDADDYRCVESLAFRDVKKSVDGDDKLIMYFQNKNWIVDIDQYMQEPDLYDDLVIPLWLLKIDDLWLILPIQYKDEMQGFVLIRHSVNNRSLNWEDRDLLKVVIDQLAGYLAIVTMGEELEEAHQFDAFNRLSAYVVHDLKNIVAQLGLLISNSDKHRYKPEFIDDVIKTNENAVSKMTRLLTHLAKNRFETETKNNITINDEIRGSIKKLSNLHPIPQFHDYNENIIYDIDVDRFTSVVENLIRNAQEATQQDGTVDIYLDKKESDICISIVDSGKGMDDEFIQNRLFKPFETTKGNAGMGIGVYDAKTFIQKIGGKLKVKSEPHKGTTFQILLPIDLY